jgi:acetyl-CoA carboxylase carboxyl transferase subunit beta
MFKINQVFKKPRYLVVQQNDSPEIQGEKNVPAIPNGLWIKCESCGETIYNKDLCANNKVCINCGYHYRMNARERIDLIMDTGTFREIDAGLQTVNPLDFPGYEDKLKESQQKTELNEGVITGYGKIHGNDAVIAVMDSQFMMGSMGSVVGERITRAFEFATSKQKPISSLQLPGGPDAGGYVIPDADGQNFGCSRQA